jgi:serine/threonine protein kinase
MATPTSVNNGNEKEEETLWDVNDTVVSLLETYNHLLEAVKLMYEHGVIHYDLKSVNVLWNSQLRKPIVIDFGLSINMRKQLTFELRKEPFYVYAPNYTLWTPEIHLLCYVIHERQNKDAKTDTLLETELSSIIEKITDNGVLMDIINAYFDGDYAAVLLNFWRDAYTDFTEREIFDKMTRAGITETWDNYALSIMYLRFIVEYGTEKVKSDPVIQDFVRILMRNIHPDPSQRLTLRETREKWNKIAG